MANSTACGHQIETSYLAILLLSEIKKTIAAEEKNTLVAVIGVLALSGVELIQALSVKCPQIVVKFSLMLKPYSDRHLQFNTHVSPITSNHIL
ncbi:MAG: hypothetical protein V7K49_06400 [Nostoc sp.]